jgi:hypothetical protein
METVVTQDSIINKIKTVNDPFVLQLIDSLLMSTTQKKQYELNESQKTSIAISREQIKNGDFTSQEDFFKELREWTKNK